MLFVKNDIADIFNLFSQITSMIFYLIFSIIKKFQITLNDFRTVVFS